MGTAPGEPSCADNFLPGAAPFSSRFCTPVESAARNSRQSGPIIFSMLPTWTFDREGERLIVQRDARDGSSCALIVTRDGLSRTIDFPELPALVRFQTDMDTFLLRTGWLLLNYAPIGGGAIGAAFRARTTIAGAGGPTVSSPRSCRQTRNGAGARRSKRLTRRSRARTTEWAAARTHRAC